MDTSSSPMSNSSFSIRQAFWNHDQAALREVRSQVFIREQQVPKALEWDGLDPAAVHILAIDNDHNPIATGRLLPSGQIGRMAVMAEWRNRGVGSAVLRHLLKLSSSLEAPALFLNAQQLPLSSTNATDFILSAHSSWKLASFTTEWRWRHE